jgi:serine phosphatase RsbU (regulator of sigma subunit)
MFLRLLYLFSLLVVLVACPVGVAAQRAGKPAPKPAAPKPFEMRELGTPYMRYFPPKETGGNAQTWGVVQDYRGIIYVATVGSILEYDGVHWREVAIPNNPTVRMLAKDSSGTIYVGAEGDFGILRPSPANKGETEFFSLKAALPEDARDFQSIWNLHTQGNKVYINTGNTIIIYSPEGAKVLRSTAEQSFHLTFLVNGVYYVREWGVGLQRLKGDKLVPVPAGELFADQRVDVMLPYNDREALVVGRKVGMFLLDRNGLRPFQNEAATFLDTNQVYHGAVAQGNVFAFGTTKGGLLLMDKQGRILKVLNRFNGMGDNNVHFVYPDAQGSLWLALGNGVTHVEWPGPFTQFAENDGLAGSVNAIARHGGRMYAATTQGIYMLAPSVDGAERARFVAVKGLTAQAWALLSVRGTLLAATNIGVFQITNGVARSLGARDEKPVPADALHVLPGDSSTVLVGKPSGLFYLKYDKGGNRWKETGTVPGVEQRVRWMRTGTAPGTVWAGNLATGVLRLDFADMAKPVVVQYDTAHGLPEMANNAIFVIDGKEYCATRHGLHRFDKDRNKFVRDQLLKQAYADSNRTIKFLHQAANRNLWAYSFGPEAEHPDGIYRLAHALRLADGSYDFERTPMLRMRGFIVKSYNYESDSLMWLGGDEGLLRVDLGQFKPYVADYQALVRVVSAKDSLSFFRGAYQDTTLAGIEQARPQIEYRLNSLRFTCSATSFDNEGYNEFQYMLRPYDDKPSAWTGESFRNYTNLREGDYTLEVRARNAYGEGSTVALYSFTILPPWYRTWWAYTLYLIGAVGLVYGIVQWRLRKLQEENRILEEKVKERTAEVVRQKDEIEKAATEIKHKNAELENAYEEIRATNESLNHAYHEIEEKNKDITDSITYAKRIQEAFLPSIEEVRHQLPDCFILFKPKDIVSGDFYWFARKGQYVFLAGLDCTGHGVPGGFMSMMGNALLNDIVIQGGRTEPSDVLDELHNKVQATLKQNMPGAKTKDGMECALLRIDTQARTVAYCSAMRPILHIRNGEMHELEINKISIGGTRYGSDERFSGQTLQCQPGDYLYTFSDGYGDQFGGDKGKKFMVKNLKDLIVGIHSQPLDEQKKTLEDRIEEWRGERPQVDDILVIGMRL